MNDVEREINYNSTLCKQRPRMDRVLTLTLSGRSVLANRLFTGFQHCLRAFKKFTYVYDAFQVIYNVRAL